MRGKVARALRHYAQGQYDMMSNEQKGEVSYRRVYRMAKKMYKESRRR